MPIDISILKDTPDVVRESEQKRYGEAGLVDRVVAKYAFWVEQKGKLDSMRKEKNDINKEIGKKKKAKENADAEVAKSKAMTEAIKVIEAVVATAEVDMKNEFNKIGNIVHESVPVSDDEANNEVISTWGEFKEGDQYQSHHQLLWRIDGYEPERGVKVAGHRGYFLKGPGVMLNQALINYALQFLIKRGYTALQPPYFMKKEAMANVAQLSDFDEQLYHVSTGNPDDDKYLIATSEQPICAYHMNEQINPKEMPLRYAGMSTCFRKEAGKHGKDTWGIFRVHQFDKIEQFVICDPEESWKIHEEMRELAEEFLQSLELPYQVVNIVSGELNNAAAKKYDIECWFPGYKEFKELVSCSNCLDYQSRGQGIRYGKGQYVHMLNSTLCALTRTICCILENHQQEDGVRVPKVLQPYLGGTEFLPFVREEKVNVNAEKIAKAAKKKEKKDGK
uniref:serine--tRNA ligase n=1 Tax=Aplanochytrium stocchinoi TaxID=215587 RepID=A0A7S3LP31_9STRA